jgi:predicted AAA+ superfamily ATPase
MLKRKAYRWLIDWKRNKTSQGLMVTGARQVGKTFLIREFAAKEYKSFVELNLIDDPTAAATLTAAKDADDLFLRISVLAKSELTEDDTLIFIDEVQQAPEIVTAIKFLAERNKYDFILSGSLLGIELKNIKSVPVGYLDIVEMFPLDFEEFAKASGLPQDAWALAMQTCADEKGVPDYLHTELMDMFYRYLIVGGMPRAVSDFMDNNNVQNVRTVQSNIVTLYKEDITKYNESDALIIKDIYDLIPSELNNQNKRFIIGKLDSQARYNRYRESFVWLAEAGVALPVFNVSEPTYPLKLSQNSNLFKLFMNDVGLLTSTFMTDTSLAILNRDRNLNYGSIFENAVAQELKANGFDLYYYRSKKRGELDFVVQTKPGNIFPIEVKSGKDYKRHNALSNIMADSAMHISTGIVLGDANVGRDGKVRYLPIYATQLIAADVLQKNCPFV